MGQESEGESHPSGGSSLLLEAHYTPPCPSPQQTGRGRDKVRNANSAELGARCAETQHVAGKGACVSLILPSGHLCRRPAEPNPDTGRASGEEGGARARAAG